MKKKQFITLVISLTLVGLFLPTLPTQAQTGLLPFAGIVSFKIDCGCTPGLSWIWFTPLYLGGPVVITGPMIYSRYSTVLYGYFNIGVPGKRHLGDDRRGIQACWIRVGKYCIPLPAIGLMSKVGTN